MDIASQNSRKFWSEKAVSKRGELRSRASSQQNISAKLLWKKAPRQLSIFWRDFCPNELFLLDNYFIIWHIFHIGQKGPGGYAERWKRLKIPLFPTKLLNLRTKKVGGISGKKRVGQLFCARPVFEPRTNLPKIWNYPSRPSFQGCQMVSFQTKNPNLGTFWRVWQ
jgi:hypothetical protein